LGQVFDTLSESTSDEKKLLAGQKAKLEAEQVKLLQAHYADAIPIALLKTEQDRIRASLQAITGRLDTLETTYDKAQVGLDAILGLLTDIGDVYAKAEPVERRMLNRALFDRITIDDEDDATLQPTEAIQTILDASPGHTTKEPCPAIMWGKARTFNFTWKQWSVAGTCDLGFRSSFPHGIKGIAA